MSDSVQTHRWQSTRLPCPWDSPGKNTGVGCHFLLQCMKVKRESEVAQSCLTLSDPMDCSPPGPSVHGIFQARVLEWGTIAFSARSIYVAANGIISFFLMAEYYSITYVYSIFFIRFSFSGHLGCFRVLAVVSNAAVNIGPHVSFWTMFLSGYMLNCGIAG